MAFIDKAKAALEAKKARIAARKEKARLTREADMQARRELYEKFCEDQFGGSGKCNRENCECNYFISGATHPYCYGCFHAPLYHTQTKRDARLEKERKESEIREKEAREASKRKAHFHTNSDAEQKHHAKANRWPCSVADCDCDKFTNSRAKPTLPLEEMIPRRGQEKDQSLPPVCRDCKHADFYHFKQEDGAKKKTKKSGGGKGRPMTAKKKTRR